MKQYYIKQGRDGAIPSTGGSNSRLKHVHTPTGDIAVWSRLGKVVNWHADRSRCKGLAAYHAEQMAFSVPIWEPHTDVPFEDRISNLLCLQP